jgi:hypothetical protein
MVTKEIFKKQLLEILEGYHLKSSAKKDLTETLIEVKRKLFTLIPEKELLDLFKGSTFSLPDVMDTLGERKVKPMGGKDNRNELHSIFKVYHANTLWYLLQNPTSFDILEKNAHHRYHYSRPLMLEKDIQTSSYHVANYFLFFKVLGSRPKGGKRQQTIARTLVNKHMEDSYSLVLGTSVHGCMGKSSLSVLAVEASDDLKKLKRQRGDITDEGRVYLCTANLGSKYTPTKSSTEVLLEMNIFQQEINHIIKGLLVIKESHKKLTDFWLAHGKKSNQVVAEKLLDKVSENPMHFLLINWTKPLAEAVLQGEE